MEFLIGRSLNNNVTNLMLHPYIARAQSEREFDWSAVVDQEPDAGLGNGGLGRLAACFLDSMATMKLPAMGYGLRYEFGMFRQVIEDGWQREHADNWLNRPDPWEVARPNETVEISLDSSVEMRGGSLHIVPRRPSTLLGIPVDRPIIGFGGETINTLRLWGASSPANFDFQEFSTGDFIGAVLGSIAAATVTRVLYPDDSTDLGRELRFVQEYFLVARSLADLVRRFRRTNSDWNTLPDKVAIQLNDTHPALAVPELMRILLDEAGLGWDLAWDLTGERSPIRTIRCCRRRWKNGRYATSVNCCHDSSRSSSKSIVAFSTTSGAAIQTTRRVRRGVSLIEERPEATLRMAHLAIVGSHSTNGVAAIHSDLLRKVTVKDIAEMYPERFHNVTNVVTPRRWLLLANPELSNIVADAIGDAWMTDFGQIARPD